MATRKNPPTKSYLRHQAALESSPEYIAHRKREQERDARAAERLESLETLYEEQASEAARLNAQAFTEDEVTAFIDYCLTTTLGWPEWMILGSEATANLDTYSGTGTRGEDGSVGLALWFKGGVFSVRASAFNQSPLIGTPYIINGNSNTMTVASPRNAEMREKESLHFEPFTDTEIDDLLQFQLTLVRADDHWYDPWEPGVAAAFAEVQKQGRIPGLPYGPPPHSSDLAAWRMGSRRNPEDNPAEAPAAFVFVYRLDKDEETGVVTPVDLRGRGHNTVMETSDGGLKLRDLWLDQIDLAQALAVGERERDPSYWVVVTDYFRWFMSVRDSDFMEVTEQAQFYRLRVILADYLGELVSGAGARDNPDGSAPDLEAHGPVDEESDVPERYKKIFHKRVAEAEAAQSEGRPALLARVKKELRLPKKNPTDAPEAAIVVYNRAVNSDGEPADDLHWSPYGAEHFYHEVDLAIALKKAERMRDIDKMVVVAEHKTGGWGPEGRWTNFGWRRVFISEADSDFEETTTDDWNKRFARKNPCEPCQENPRDEPEPGDRVTRYKAQGSLRGVEGTVVRLVSHPKLNWTVALVHWDNGEKREHPMHVLQLVPRKSTRNPEDFVEDGIDPRYVGWDVPEDEEPHTSVGLPSYENVPTFLAPDEDRPLLERMFSRADTAMEMAGQTLRKLRKNGTHDQPDYHWYVVDLTEKRILSGWSYREDAGDARRETEAEHPFEDPARFKVVFESRLAKLGLDPDNDRSWELAPVPQEVLLMVFDLYLVTDNWYPRSTFAEVRETYRDLPEALAEAQKLRDIDKLVLIDAEGPIWMVSAGDSEFETIDDGQVPNWRELVERLLNG